MCDGELCHPLYNITDRTEAVKSDIFYCDVEDETGILPKGWGYFKKSRKLFCPRCLKHYEDKRRE
jgi:hypothetical protein